MKWPWVKRSTMEMAVEREIELWRDIVEGRDGWRQKDLDRQAKLYERLLAEERRQRESLLGQT